MSFVAQHASWPPSGSPTWRVAASWRILIDTQAHVHGKCSGGKPLADVEFLEQSVKGMNQQAQTQPIAAAQRK